MVRVVAMGLLDRLGREIELVEDVPHSPDLIYHYIIVINIFCTSGGQQSI